MEEVLIHGKMEENIKDSTSLIKNTVSVLILGKMVEDMSDNGRIVNDMEGEKLYQLMEVRERVCGNRM